MPVIDANIKLFADRMDITSQRMIRDYATSTVDEIIEAEAKKGNMKALDYAREYGHSTSKLIKTFRLSDVENRFSLIKKMTNVERSKLLPQLEQEDLVMGLYFFGKESLLKMLLDVDTVELIRVVFEAFPQEEVVKMFSEKDLAQFFMQRDLKKEDVLEQLQLLPPDMMQKFIESVTGQPMEDTNLSELINDISELPKEQFGKFMASIDPDVQRQLTFQITKEKPEYFTLFSNMSYLKMLDQLIKPEMVKPMIMLNHETLVKFINKLPNGFISIVAAQLDEEKFARFLQKGHMRVIENAIMT